MRVLLSLITDDNDYQVEQAVAAQEASHRLGIDISIIYAGNDGVNQSQQLLKVIQGNKESRPDGIIVEPAGTTALPHVARAAVSAGIAWGVLNREVDYLKELRTAFRVPAFAVTSDHLEIGRIQSQQIRALLPNGGVVLYIQGPSSMSAASLRTKGTLESKPANIRLITRSCPDWTLSSGHKAVSTWLSLSTSHSEPVSLIAAQNDAFAVGARKALSELPEGERDRWIRIPYLGVDGLPRTGIAWVRDRLLKATVVVPPNTVPALEILNDALRKHVPAPENTPVPPSSYPPLSSLRPEPTNVTGQFLSGMSASKA